MIPTLRTERLLLEPYIAEDEEDFVALFQDTRVSRWMGDGPASEAADRALFGRIFTKVYAQELFDVWAVRRDGLLVGHAEIKPTDVVGGHEIIYALAPTAWGFGLGTEVAEAIVAHGFDTLGLTKVYATVAAPNKASLRFPAGWGEPFVWLTRPGAPGVVQKALPLVAFSDWPPGAPRRLGCQLGIANVR